MLLLLAPQHFARKNEQEIMNIVLVNPEIPQNTGSIARTCAATMTPLHLIKPYGFELSEKRVRRAGLDYWPHVQLSEHDHWEAFSRTTRSAQCWFFTKFANKNYWDASFQSDDYLVFGRETKGLGEDFLSQQDPERLLRIPMTSEHVRSLNLSNAVSIVLYEALRQEHQRAAAKLSVGE